MNVTVAKLLTLVASDTSDAEVISDPMALGEMNQASAIPLVHYYNAPALPVLTYVTQVSNDGIYWVDQGPTEAISLTATGAQTQKVAAVNGAFMRVKFTYGVGGSGSGGCCLDLQVALDRTS